MQALSSTYEKLAATRNVAAIEVLASVLMHAKDQAVRSMALNALAQRGESTAPVRLISIWESLTDQDLAILRGKTAWIEPPVLEMLASDETETIHTGIEVAKTLAIHSAIEPLVSLAESSPNRPTQEAATRAILELVVPLGREAREDQSQRSDRLAVVKRLAESVDTFTMHRNASLVDAFLIASTWSDRDLRQMLADRRQPMKLILSRFGKTKHPGVVDLLAGFVRRKKVPSQIIELIQIRSDVGFRNALLAAIGSEPPMTVIRNLREMSIPASCVGGARVLDELNPSQHPAWMHLYGAACQDPIVTMQVAVKGLRSGGAKAIPAAAVALSRCEVLDIEYWMRSAVPVADDDAEEIASDPDSQLLKDLIDLLDHPEASIVRGIRRVLGPMHAEAMLPRMEALRPRSRRRLGRVIMMVDLEAIDRVRDALRHPVLKKRLEAIAMADALALVDLLTDSFAHISAEDHQEARMLAANVMADATSDETLGLLEDMLRLPASPVRDAAEAALVKRQKLVERQKPVKRQKVGRR